MNKFEETLQILTATGLEPLPVDFDSKDDYDNDGKPNDEEVNCETILFLMIITKQLGLCGMMEDCNEKNICIFSINLLPSVYGWMQRISR